MHRRLASVICIVTACILAPVGIEAQEFKKPGLRSPAMATRIIALKKQLIKLTPDEESDVTNVEVAMAQDAQGTLVSFRGSFELPDPNVEPTWSDAKAYYWAIDKRRHSVALFRLTDEPDKDAEKIYRYLQKYGRGDSRTQLLSELNRERSRRANALARHVAELAISTGTAESTSRSGGPSLTTNYCSGIMNAAAVVKDPVNIEITRTAATTFYGVWRGDNPGIDWVNKSPTCYQKPDDVLSHWIALACTPRYQTFGCGSFDYSTSAEHINFDFPIGTGQGGITDIFATAAVNMHPTFGPTWAANSWINGTGFGFLLLTGTVESAMAETCLPTLTGGGCTPPGGGGGGGEGGGGGDGGDGSCEPLTPEYCDQMCEWPYTGADEDRDCNGWDDWDDCDFNYGECIEELSPSPEPIALASTAPLAAGQLGAAFAFLLAATRRARRPRKG